MLINGLTIIQGKFPRKFLSSLSLVSFARAAVTKYQTGELKQQKFIFSHFWRLKVQDQGVMGFGFSWSLSLWLTDGCFLTVSSDGFSSMSLSSLFPLLQGHLSYWIRPYPRTSFNPLITPLKVQSLNTDTFGIKASHIKFGGDIILSKT